VRGTSVSDILALRELLPRDHSLRVPADFTAAATCRAIDAPNWVWGCEVDRLTP
jgi:hypothetical protein